MLHRGTRFFGVLEIVPDIFGRLVPDLAEFVVLKSVDFLLDVSALDFDLFVEKTDKVRL